MPYRISFPNRKAPPEVLEDESLSMAGILATVEVDGCEDEVEIWQNEHRVARITRYGRPQSVFWKIR